jgi:hypothetical protein
MIQINLMSQQDHERVRALVNFYNRSFSQRHPELAKKKCPYCKLKFTQEELKNHKHILNHEVDFGSSQFKGKRFHPHYGKRGLQLVERVREIIRSDVEDLPLQEFQKELKNARTEAGRQLRKEWASTRKKKRDQQKLSRRINRA